MRESNVKVDLGALETEQRNSRTMEIDTLSTLEMVRLINREDQAVIDAIERATPQIAAAIDAIVLRLQQGGRLIYVGAGTSGRLGVLDASECLPTFGVGEESVLALIAGGDRALRHPVEAAEDQEDAAIVDLAAVAFSSDDILCAIASSGRTPYALSALQYAKSLGAATISLASVSESKIGKVADYPIEVIVGPEVITGSTRMKAGSAQKMVLNMLSTGTMIKLGKVYQNWMVDLRATNKKLIERARQMVMMATGIDYNKASQLLEAADYHVKSAIVMALLAVDYQRATQLLAAHQGVVRAVLAEADLT
ncbi:N-acetylmuramic acid 6-phosphate etherase [Ignatzschineria indica]|uniref:N-acetylmuramic acid 6-phosphate etherase n=1 Tax=Ignatzschineria indica TaxID=472583 RepID=A0A2U2APB3_9GAMM|nr:N-acetylmuramic acid 6-phosphate etherase [Ignatzschineria indica]PWD85017.1 N-acetylmuramic acid 6-phosphate etherase [Ignatzschineria indica]GGZ80885.1 N-acetylmuramic acid 6-phosphate etherase [Ignatzschineria indica]